MLAVEYLLVMFSVRDDIWNLKIVRENLEVFYFVELGAHQIHFTTWLCQLGDLNKDPTVWLGGARPPKLLLLVLDLPENQFNEL
jgi:hypothetical protein